MADKGLLQHLHPWGIERVLSRFEEGHRNAVYLVERSGKTFVAKTTRRDEAQVRWLGPLHEAARAAGFVVPQMIPAKDGDLVANGMTLETYESGETVARDALPQLQA